MATDEALASKFRALGDPSRMRIFRMLMSNTGLDPTASEVCARVSESPRINSTISHHLKELRYAGLIEVERQGRRMICRPKPDGVREMLNFLLDVE